jgi:alkylation response protein AidB-like acyl-CoA dehydrogenase
MDFTFSEEQEAAAAIAGQIFQARGTVERVKALEASPERFDRELWGELASANLLGLSLPEDVGGSGFGLVELCLVLEQQGRVVTPVPLLATLTTAMAVAEFGTAEQRKAWLPGVAAGDAVLTAALEPGGVSVPAAHLADRIAVPLGDGRLGLVDPSDASVSMEVAETTNRDLVGHLTVGPGADVEPLGGDDASSRAEQWLRDRWLVGLCALQVGVTDAALRLTAEYTSNRTQFGKPLSTFQGVAIKAADAYIAIEAMRVTMLQAAWRLDEPQPRDAREEVLVAKWWAAESGHRVVHITQHLHGGVGADIDYPVHRYFLWGKQLEVALGGAGETLSRLGAALADRPPRAQEGSRS